MFKERKKKEIEFLKTNLPKLVNYLNKKIDYKSLSKKEIKKKENKYISNYLDYKASNKELNKINKLKLLKKTKYAESFYFTITELGESNKDFYNCETLYDWTKKNWQFQKDANIEAIEDQIKYKKEKGITEEECNLYFKEELFKIEERYGKDYISLYLYGTWVRWIEDNRLKYGAIQSIESWVVDKISEYIDDFIEEKIPTCYVHPINEMFVPSERNSKFVSLNTELRANGREKEYDNLRKKLYKYNEKIVNRITRIISNKYSGLTFMEEIIDNEKEPFINIYVTDLLTSKKIMTKSFLSDIIKYQQSFKLIENLYNELLVNLNIKEDLVNIYNQNKKEINNEI